MQQYDMTFRSMTAAQQALFELSRAGIAARLIRTPKQISSTGCGYALRIGADSAQSAVLTLRQSGLGFERMIQTQPGGYSREVRP